MLRRKLRRRAVGTRALPQHLTITGALALALCLLALLVVGSDQAQALGEDDYRDGEIVVRLQKSFFIEQILADYRRLYSLRRIDERLPHNLETEENPIYLLKTSDERGAKAVANDLDIDPRVEDAEPNYVMEAPEAPEYAPTGDGRFRARVIETRDDASTANKTFAEKLNLSTCNRSITGATVAVLDTGAQLDHPALRGNFRGVDRYDFVGNDSEPYDSRVGLNVDHNGIKDQLWGHGTHVAGVVDRVAPGAKIMPVRVLDSEGYGDVYDIARGIAFARGHGADVVNLSLGTSTPSKILEKMIAETTSPEYNVVVAAAAGNSGTEDPHYPAAGSYGTGGIDPPSPPQEGLLAVISVKTPLASWKKSDFANFGYWVGIAAPGEDIRSTYPGDRYAIWSGTSMATPFISGQAALIRAKNTRLNPEDIEQKIRTSARNIDADNGEKYLLKLGAGHANVCGSL
jgi:thermitase